MLNILWIIILIIILFFIILLYIGLRLKLIYNKTGSKIEGCLEILILNKIRVYTLTFPQNNDKNEEKKDLKKLYKLSKACFNDFKTFLKDFVNCTNIHILKNHLVFGLDSYADTGKYIGYIWAFQALVISTVPNSILTAEPSFKGEIFDINGEFDIDINILKLIPPIIRLLSKKEVRALIRGVIDG